VRHRTSHLSATALDLRRVRRRGPVARDEAVGESSGHKIAITCSPARSIGVGVRRESRGPVAAVGGRTIVGVFGTNRRRDRSRCLAAFRALLGDRPELVLGVLAP